jgi:outer membrane protein OmpA-like peptidoglycan-associated protein
MLAMWPLVALLSLSAPDAGAAPQAALEDFDHDGIPDIEDDCPTDPGTKDGKGCPPNMKPPPKKTKPEAVEVKSDRIDISEHIEFKSGSATVDPKSYGLIEQIAAGIKTVPEGKHIVVAGHTDDRGGKAMNVTLSKKRAEAVIAHLVRAGIARTRLSAEGYGPNKPIADNKTEEGRAKNRRVEFIISDPTQ